MKQCVAVVGWLCVAAGTALAQGTPQRPPASVTTIEFTEAVLEGTLYRPPLEWVSALRRGHPRNLVELRRNFRTEVSVDASKL